MSQVLVQFFGRFAWVLEPGGVVCSGPIRSHTSFIKPVCRPVDFRPFRWNGGINLVVNPVDSTEMIKVFHVYMYVTRGVTIFRLTNLFGINYAAWQLVAVPCSFLVIFTHEGIVMKNSFFSISEVLTLQLHTAQLVRHCLVGCRLSTSGFTNNQKTRDQTPNLKLFA